MIRLRDAFILAYTKLRVHRVRTGVAVGVSGILFGLIAAVIIVTQGIFSSIESFSDVGLNNRAVLNVTQTAQGVLFNEYDHKADPKFVAEVERRHEAFVKKKVAAAQKFGIPYDPALEDPSPVSVDPKTKQKVLSDSSLSDSTVTALANEKRLAAYKPFDVNKYLEKYSSAKVIQVFKQIQPSDGMLTYMKEDKENFTSNNDRSMYFGNEETPSLTILDSSLSKPFIANTTFDPLKGEIPVILPFNTAEKLLGLKKMDANATTQEKVDRIREVRDRIGEVTATYCYRNNASQGLLMRAIAQKEEIERGANDAGYVKPVVLYKIPNEKSCGAVKVIGDTRTANQKRQDSQRVLYEKEIGAYIGEPEQHLITMRGVGVSSEMGSMGQGSVSDIIQGLFSSSLGYGAWNIPADLLEKVPEAARPAAVFAPNDTPTRERIFFGYEAYLVDFTDKEEARALLRTGGIFGISGAGSVYAVPFGSGVLVVDELKTMFTNVLLWALAVVGGVAIIILASIIGRTVSEGRRESSIFRAIGASRIDIGSVYGTYVILLSLRIVLFAAILGILIALTVEILFWKEATLGAQFAYASSDLTKEFHLFSLASPYLLWIAGAIIVAGIVASIVPILLGARRNPIKDMRNDG